MVKIDSLNNNIKPASKATTAIQAYALDVKTKGDTKIKANGDLSAESCGKVSVKGTETTYWRSIIGKP